jgi:hypothetical protein
LVLLKDSQRRTTLVKWPVEIDDHLDLLIRLAAADGIQISRAQMLSALVANVDLSGTAMAEVARRYLMMSEGDLASSALPQRDRLPVVRHRGRQRTPPASTEEN